MVSKPELTETRNDGPKFVAAIILAVAAVFGYYYFSEFSLLYRVLALLVVAGIAVALVYNTAKGQSTWKFFQDSRTEVRKVVWPTTSETMQTTLIVMVIVVLVSLFLWFLDWLFSSIFRYLAGI